MGARRAGQAGREWGPLAMSQLRCTVQSDIPVTGQGDLWPTARVRADHRGPTLPGRGALPPPSSHAPDVSEIIAFDPHEGWLSPSMPNPAEPGFLPTPPGTPGRRASRHLPISTAPTASLSASKVAWNKVTEKGSWPVFGKSIWKPHLCEEVRASTVGHGQTARPRGLSALPPSAPQEEPLCAGRATWDIQAAPAPQPCPRASSRAGPGIHQAGSLALPPGCPSARLETRGTWGPEGHGPGFGRAAGQEKRGQDSARALHPPGVRLAVVLSRHDVFKELPASDPGKKHTKVTGSRDRRHPVPSSTMATSCPSSPPTSALCPLSPGPTARQVLPHTGGTEP